MKDRCPDQKKACSAFFSSASETYDAVAHLQRATGHDLLEMVGMLDKSSWILDVGSGTGYFSALLDQGQVGSGVIALDLSEGMLRRARSRFGGGLVLADAEVLPIASASVDLIFSNLCIQWCPQVDQVFIEFARVLKPSGQLVFSTMGAETLVELREAWSKVDHHPHVMEFHTEALIESAMRKAGFLWGERKLSTEVTFYPDVMALMNELRALGARNASSRRVSHLTGRQRFSDMVKHYMARQGVALGRVPATFSIIAGRCILAP